MKLEIGNKTTGNMAIGVLLGATLTFVADKIYKAATRYDKDGYDKDGYNREGFDCNGYDREGRDPDGFDRFGRDKDGFDRNNRDINGFDKNGLDADGFDQEGYKRGFNREGRDRDGYDRSGYNANGYNRQGFAKDGFNKEGFDSQGYARNGYNTDGIDRVRQNRQFYINRLEQLQNTLDKVFVLMDQNEYGYAVYDSRRVLEEILEQYIKHFCGEAYLGETIRENIDICVNKKLIGNDTAQRLHKARQICNTDPHEFDARESLNNKNASFVVWQVQELLEVAKDDLAYRQE